MDAPPVDDGADHDTSTESDEMFDTEGRPGADGVVAGRDTVTDRDPDVVPEGIFPDRPDTPPDAVTVRDCPGDNDVVAVHRPIRV